MNLQNIFNDGRLIYLFCRDDKALTITKIENFYPYYYELDSAGTVNTYDNKKARKIILPHPSDVKKMRSNSSYEADIIYTKRFIIDRIDTIQKSEFKFIFLDIEVLAKEMPDTDKASDPISCISIYNSLHKNIQTWFLKDFSDEFSMIYDFIDYVHTEQPDLILAWNMDFDYQYLYNRIPKLLLDAKFSDLISPIHMSRIGKNSCLYPAGISILDFMGLYQKLTLNKKRSYALDYIAQEDLNEQAWGDTVFGELNDQVKAKNINDVNRMIKLNEKFNVLNYFDEIRRLVKCLWEDLPQERVTRNDRTETVSNNSKIIDILMLEEARELNIVLPTKADSGEDERFEGAYRDSLETGAFENISKYDLGSAYPTQIVDFCLDPSNLTTKDSGTEINITSRVDGRPIATYYFKQNTDALLPRVIKRLLKLKNELKVLASSGELEHKIKYDAIKSIVNSAYGVMGNRFFRLYSKEVAESTTFLVRNLLQFIMSELKELNYRVLYVDTDSVFIQDNGVDSSELLNNLIQKWATNNFHKDSSVEFAYEGVFEKILLLAKCHYYALLRTKKGIKPEIKGLEIKRSSSSKYEALFQKQLIETVLNHKNENRTVEFIKTEIENIKTKQLLELAFPCKIKGDYKNEPVFVKAVQNSQLIFKKFNVGRGELFYYIFVKSKGLNKSGKELDVIAIKENINLYKYGLELDWDRIIDRAIFNKVQVIFDAMKWKDIKLTLSGQKLLF
jgi:DNA polymerase, archaea type